VERFTFRLENILRLRKKMEEGCELDFSRKKAELLKIEGEIRDTKEKLSNFFHDNSYMEGIFTASDIIAVDNYINRVENIIKGLTSMRFEKEDEVDRSLNVLKEAKKQRKVIENLKNRMLEKYLYELDREEKNELDDINQHINLNKENLTIEDVPLEDI